MTDVKEAAKKAIRYFSDLMGDNISDIWLEEVELSHDEKLWYITLSALAPTRKTVITPLAEISDLFGSTKGERMYKRFTVDADTNVVKSMKIPKPG